MAISEPGFWLALAQIIWIDLLLSGDNAVVIAMACRGLSPRRRRVGMILGAGVAVMLRVLFAGVVTTLMSWPWLKLGGGIALFWVAANLVAGGDENEEASDATDSLLRAIWIIAVADVVMSLDNVIAIAAAAKGSWLLLMIGLAISIPMIVAGSAFLMAVLDRFPIVVWAGCALLGFIAGELIATDPGLAGFIGHLEGTWMEKAAGIAGALIAMAIGYALRQRRQHAPEPT